MSSGAMFTAVTGTAAQQRRIDLIAHNLANVGTVGFKRQRSQFEDLLYENVRGPAAEGDSPTGLQFGRGTRIVHRPYGLERAVAVVARHRSRRTFLVGFIDLISRTSGSVDSGLHLYASVSTYKKLRKVSYVIPDPSRARFQPEEV